MKKSDLLKGWANSLPQNQAEIEIDVSTIPRVCNADGSLIKSYRYNHGYYFHYEKDPIYQAYTNAGFSFISYDEATLKMKLKKTKLENTGTEKTNILDNMNEADNIETHFQQDEDLKVVCINDLSGKCFYIPDYQRGYRWLDEAGEFVKDIQENTSDEYLLQPVVVKKMDDKIKQAKGYNQRLSNDGNSVIDKSTGQLPDGEVYELIDGQQRLTTLFLTIRTCDQKPNFEIYYENERPLDNHYIELAKKVIDDNLKSQALKEDFYKKLQNQARYIWYEDKTSRTAEEVFRSLNADKTELTSAELFKALMLNDSDEKKRRFWADRLDEIEIRLNDEDLWRFMADNKYISNRIELVLNIYAHGLNKELHSTKGGSNIQVYKDRAKDLDGDGKSTVFFDSRYAFLSLSNYIEWQKYKKQSVQTSDEIGDAILDIFETLCSWHRDYRTHNLIGFLIACKGKCYEERIKMIYTSIDYWTEAIMLTTKDNSFGPTEINYLH